MYVFDDEFPSFSKSLVTYSFQHKHASNVLANPASAKFLMEAENSDYIIQEIDSYPFKPLSITLSYNFKQLFKNILPYTSKKFYGGEVIGGFNGLICLYFGFYRELKKQKEVFCGGCMPLKKFHHFILWNPFTGEHHAIPTPQGLRLNVCRGRNLSVTVSGFGYDSVNKTYKLVIGEGAITQLYNLLTNAWKIVETIDINWDDYANFRLYYSDRSKPQFGYFVNGALHWIASSRGIASIDLSTEVCSFLNMPHCCSKTDSQHRLNMGVVKGCLSVSCYRFVDKSVSIWMMKEYGREESWTNIINIKLSETDMLPGPRHLMVLKPPLWVSRDHDEMLFLVGGKLAYWDPKDEKLNYVEGLKFDSSFRGIVHVDTLVSPKPEVYG
ncbi:F-box/kelch-repeat protein At3g23880-like [Silene latifolia]|uniref:F-box/kelch-repeat protein At3g23880-like n=1 Tax=Silene latifolia TaxID=37657 RepID=UPI003D77C72D